MTPEVGKLFYLTYVRPFVIFYTLVVWTLESTLNCFLQSSLELDERINTPQYVCIRSYNQEVISLA